METPADDAAGADEVAIANESTGETATNSDEETTMDKTNGKLLRHAVFFSFNEGTTEQEIESVTSAFAALPEKIDSIIDFQWGTNNSPEKLDDGFTHGFLLTFKDEAGRDAYLPHPAHPGEFADALKPHMKDVFVIDYWGNAPQAEIQKELKHAVFFKFKDDADPAAVKNVEQAFASCLIKSMRSRPLNGESITAPRVTMMVSRTASWLLLIQRGGSRCHTRITRRLSRF